MRGSSSGGISNGGRHETSAANGIPKSQAALYSSGDLNPVERLRVRLHVRIVRQMRDDKPIRAMSRHRVLRSQIDEDAARRGLGSSGG